jgi:hypothetical protein
MVVTPNSAYLYVAATASILQESNINPKHWVDYRFGLLLAHTMLNIHSSLVAERREEYQSSMTLQLLLSVHTP